jgi:hypothetical protein
MYAFLLVSAINAIMLTATYLTLFAILISNISFSTGQVALVGAVARMLLLNMIIQMALALQVWKVEKSSLQKLSHFTQDA